MKSEDTSLFDDATTPGYVRDLLQAGRRANLDGAYDVERGLARHLAAIASAPAAAPWAPTPVTTVATVATKVWPSWVGFAAMPLAAASVAGLLWVYSADRPSANGPSAHGNTSSTLAPAPAEAPGVNAAPSAVRPSATLDSNDLRSGDEARPSGSERRRSGVRPNAVRGSRSASSARATGESDLDGVAIGAIGSGEGSASEARSGDSASKRSAAAEPSVATAEARSVQSQAQALSNEQRATADEPAQAAAAERSGSSPVEAANKPAPVIDESRLEREMQMLAVTQRVLASDPGRALRLSEQGEREFSGSMFSAERRQLGLLALVKLGRLDEARRAGKPFLARYPKAPWSERLRRALATGVVE